MANIDNMLTNISINVIKELDTLKECVLYVGECKDCRDKILKVCDGVKDSDTIRRLNKAIKKFKTNIAKKNLLESR
jgi:hypothetical protein